ncbi:MAG: sulfatase [Candidatus Omnitrophica bacterium]|nr:sulfatase [Candidatus Omnitrophota bacterium]
MIKKPNILFIVLDGVRAQSLSCYGNKKQTSPHLDAFAEKCVIYKKAFATANNSNSSHTSLLTGLYPNEHGVYADQPFFKKQSFSLANILHNAGYATYLINPIYLLSYYFGHTAGFDGVYQMWQFITQSQNEDIFYNSNFHKLPKWRRYAYYIKHLLPLRSSARIFTSLANRRYSHFFDIYNDSSFATTRSIDRAIKTLQRNTHTPIFMYLVLMEAHEEYNPPNRIRSLFNIPRQLKSCHQLDHYTKKRITTHEEFAMQKSLYEASIYFQDEQLGRLLSCIESLGASDDMMVIVVADHGGHFGEKGHCGNLLSLYNEVIHVPLLVKYPSYTEVKPAVNDFLVQTTDIYATVLEVLGMPNETGSISLLTDKKRKAAFSEMIIHPSVADLLDANLSRSLRAVIHNDGFKYIDSEKRGSELYNILDDPHEERNLNRDPKYHDTREMLAGLLAGFNFRSWPVH